MLLLDAEDTALRAARGNFGLVWVQGKGAYFPPYADWTMRSSELWPKLVGELLETGGPALGLHQEGGLSICLSEAEMRQRYEKLDHLRAHQNGRFQFEMLDRSALKEIMPGIGPKVVGAAYCPHDGHVNPLYLMRALQTGLTRNGGVCLANAAVRRIDKKGNRSLVWARIFDTYGPYENEKKFCSYVIKNCINQKKITCNNPQLGMDFLHVQDIANAFKFIIDGDFLGTINISSGSTCTLEYISKYITKKFNSEELLELNNSSNDRRKFFGNNAILKNLGWRNKYSIKDGLDDLIKFYVKKYE